MSALSSYFNPRSHEGSDLWRSWCSLAMRLFQSTLPRGERLGEIGKKDKTQVFQSTLPRGERQQQDQCHSRNCNFNPRSHEGSDLAHALSGCEVDISIHAPTRGATYTRKNVSLSTRLFQSSLPRGERPQTALAGIPTTYFNPRSHEGSDSGSLGSNAGAMDFNPRSHEGSDNYTNDLYRICA